VRYVALHRALFTGPVSPNARWFAERGLLRNGFRPVATDGTVTTFRAGRPPSPDVEGEPPRGRPILCDGWDGTTTKDEHASLWIHGGGLLVVELDASPPVRTTIAVDGARLPTRVISRGSGIEVEVAGRGWHRVELESEETGVRLVEARFSAA
jgi:hypothetical protein